MVLQATGEGLRLAGLLSARHPGLIRLRCLYNDLHRKQYSMSDYLFNLSLLGHALKEARLQRGLRQADVATIAALPRLKVVQVEAGRPTVGVEAYAKIAAALGGQLQLVPAHRPTLDELGALFDDRRGAR